MYLTMNERSSREPQEKSEEEKENVREAERYLDRQLENLIEKHADFIAEGNNGAIFRLNTADIPEEIRLRLESLGILKDSEKGQAIKILKIYSRGQGRREFENQRRAYEIAITKKDDPDYAQVPEPYFYRDLKISEEAEKKIQKTTTNFRPSGRVEVLIMDYIPGKDVAVLLYREIIKHHPKTRHLVMEIDRLPFEELRVATETALGFAVPGGKARDEGERINEELRLQNQNTEKMLSFLHDVARVQVDPRIVTQMQNLISLFHQNGFTIHDGHHRNFMVTGDFTVQPGEQEQPPRAFIIDFENAVTDMPPGLSEQEIREGYLRVADTEGRNFHDPRIPIRHLERLTSSPTEREHQEKFGGMEKIRQDVEKLRKRIEQQLTQRPNERFSSYEARLESMLKEKEVTPAEAYAIISTHPLGTMDTKIDNFLVSALRLREKNPELAEKIRTLLLHAMEKARPAERKKMDDFLKIVE